MDEEDPFLPLRPLVGGTLRDRRERDRERRIAEHVSRRIEHRGHAPRQVRGLSLPDIIDTAIAVADAEGTEAVCMRRIAREMRVGAMSLYWYVGSKEELHQLMLEKVQAEAEAPEPSGNWRADLRGYARNTRAALLRHPWAIDFLGIGPPSGPNDARNLRDGRGAPRDPGDPLAAQHNGGHRRHDRDGNRRVPRRIHPADLRVRALPAHREDH